MYVDTSFTNARMQVSVNLIDSLSITGLEYGTTFLAIQILADFEIKYLSLPESYDNNFAIYGLCLFWASDAS